MSIWRAIIYYLYTHIGQFHWEISPDLTQYQQIGNRYFIFENDVELSWTDAERACQKKGGHLATIKDEEEMYHIVYQIEDLTYYWLGINDHDNKGDFMSLASGKKFPFLWWADYEPSYTDDRKNCVSFLDGQMWLRDCHMLSNFICQADKEF